MFQNSHEVIEYITKRTKRDYGLSEFKQYIEKMGNPQYQLKCIHVVEQMEKVVLLTIYVPFYKPMVIQWVLLLHLI